MAPHIKSEQLKTRTARMKLVQRGKPYRVSVAPGITLGYRRNAGPGTWSAIVADGSGGSWLQRLALADDQEEANGTTILTFWQAAEAAKKLARAPAGIANAERPVSVADAVEAYKRDLAGRSGNPWNAAGLLPKLSPTLLAKPVSQLTKNDVRAFRDTLIASGIKASTVNRYMTQFIAALNVAASADERIVNTKAWQLEILPNAQSARRVILEDHQVQAIIAAAYRQDAAWGLLVDVLAQTGTRISQARALAVADILPRDRLDMPVSRKGSAQKAAPRRPVPISEMLAARLRMLAAGRRSDAPLLIDTAGKPWKVGCQSALFPNDVRAAGLDQSITCYALRHSSIARQLLAGVPPAVVASNHDTGIEQIQAHYAKYITDISDAVTRKALLAPPPIAANDNYSAGSLAL